MMIAKLVRAKPGSADPLGGVVPVPHSGDRMVGPFAQFVHIGPVTLPPGLSREADARPHPHTGHTVLVYLLAGSATHRDSLGNTIECRAGDVALMTAGAGIVHSERVETIRAHGGTLHALVAFIALPAAVETISPDFALMPGDTLPVIAGAGVTSRLLVGGALGRTAPGVTFSPLYMLRHEVAAGAGVPFAAGHAERALFVISGRVEIDDVVLGPGDMAVLGTGAAGFTALDPASAIEFGGAPVGERWRWWNFFATDVARIDAAKARWAAGGMKLPPDDAAEFIPLPRDDERPLVRLRPGT